MTEASLLDRVCEAFGRFEDGFKGRARAQIGPAGEDILHRKDWPFRKVEKEFTFAAAGDTDVELPDDFHHWCYLRTDGVPKIELVSNAKYAAHKSDPTAANPAIETSKPKLRFCWLLKDPNKPGNLMLARFYPKAAGGEKVQSAYIQIAKVANIGEVPVFLHTALWLGVVAMLSRQLVQDKDGNTYLSPAFRQNWALYTQEVDDQYVHFTADPAQEMRIRPEAGLVRAAKNTRFLRGV